MSYQSKKKFKLAEFSFQGKVSRDPYHGVNGKGNAFCVITPVGIIDDGQGNVEFMPYPTWVYRPFLVDKAQSLKKGDIVIVKGNIHVRKTPVEGGYAKEELVLIANEFDVIQPYVRQQAGGNQYQQRRDDDNYGNQRPPNDPPRYGEDDYGNSDQLDDDIPF